MKPQYSHQQIIFALNSIANAPSGHHGTVSELECYATKVINTILVDPGVIPLIGEWKLVWGPVVFQASGSTVADNAMYVAQSQSDTSQFVVAISGTNPISAYGWIVEDVMINPPVSWPYGDGSVAAGKITKGTSVGLGVLLDTMQSNGQSLLQYLADQVSSSSADLSITVTGHSLGGALSPSTALALRDTQGIALGQPNGWDPDSKSTIAVLPSAGPTPGNKIWRDYYDKSLGSNTDRLWNKIDMVPHAWQISMLKEVPTLYMPTIPENALVDKLVKLAIINSTLAGNLQQIRPDVIGLPGTVNPSIKINVRDIAVILETLLADDLLDRLAEHLPVDLLALLKVGINDLIKYLNGQTDKTAKIDHHTLASVRTTSLDTIRSEHQSLDGLLKGFLDFLVQAAYQHTTAYQILIGTTEFSAIVEAIEEKES